MRLINHVGLHRDFSIFAFVNNNVNNKCREIFHHFKHNPMQNRKSTATPAYSMPQCETRYLRGKETKMIQTYPNNVRLIVNLDTEESRLMVGSRLLDIYNGTDIEKMRRITSAAESLSLTIGHRSPDRVRILS